MRKAIAILAVLAAALPFGLSQAQHCDSDIILFSRVNVNAEGTNVGNPTYHSGSIGCALAEPGADDTDIIYPGSTALKVRWISAAAPVSATLTFGGQTQSVTLAQDPSAPINSTTWDSQWMPIDPTTTGNATVTVCVGDGTLCQTRVYRTVA